MYLTVIILIIAVCVFLVLAILSQSSKGGASSVLGGGSTQMLGVQRTSDLLEKITWGLAISLMVAFALAIF